MLRLRVRTGPVLSAWHGETNLAIALLGRIGPENPMFLEFRKFQKMSGVAETSDFQGRRDPMSATTRFTSARHNDKTHRRTNPTEHTPIRHDLRRECRTSSVRGAHGVHKVRSVLRGKHRCAHRPKDVHTEICAQLGRHSMVIEQPLVCVCVPGGLLKGGGQQA